MSIISVEDFRKFYLNKPFPVRSDSDAQVIIDEVTNYAFEIIGTPNWDEEDGVPFTVKNKIYSGVKYIFNNNEELTQQQVGDFRRYFKKKDVFDKDDIAILKQYTKLTEDQQNNASLGMLFSVNTYAYSNRRYSDYYPVIQTPMITIPENINEGD